MEKPYPPWFKPYLKRLFKSTSDPLAFFEYLVKDDDIVRLPVLKPNYIVNDPDAIQHILITNRDNYTKAGTSYERIEQVVGKGVLTTSGEDWAKRREKFQPQFQSKNLKNQLESIQKYTDLMLKGWSHKNGQSINITEEMLSLVMNISAEVFLGVDISDRSLDMVRMIHILNEYAVRSITLWKWLPTMRNVRYQVAKKTVDNFILTSLKNADSFQHPPLLIDLFKKDKENNFVLSDEEILGEVKNFFVAGHETTGNALSWTLYCLAKNPYVLMQVQQELKNVVGTKQPTFEMTHDLPYLEMVIQESLRLYPAIWIFTRRAIEEDQLLNYRIPANAIINILPYLIHRHPKYWHQPDVFYPERFSQEGSRGRPKFAYIPFGSGPRVCIGKHFALLNMKVILSNILQKFEISLPRKNYSVIASPLITLKPQKGMHLRITRRPEDNDQDETDRKIVDDSTAH